MSLTTLDQAEVSAAPLTGDIPRLAEQILRMREGEQRRLHKIDRYMRGEHESVYVPNAAKGEYEWLRKRSVVNFLPLIVGVVSQNLHVDGYRPSATSDITDDFSVTVANAHAAMESDDIDGARQILARGAFKNAAAQLKPADDEGPWSAFMANRLASKQHGLHDAVATFGIAYTVVLPGKPQPVIRPVSPRIMTALYADDIDDEWPIYAVEERVLNSPLGKRRVVRLYDDQNVYTLTGKAAGNELSWPSLDDPLLGTTPAVSEHGLGVCPVVRFLHKLDLDGDQRVSGVAEPLIPLQDQLNTTMFNLLMGQQYTAFRQRWVTGMVPDDEDGRPREPFRSGVDRLMVAESTETKFGEFGQSALGDFLASMDATIRNMSTISQLPPYQLLGTVANLSADALAAAKDGQDRMVDEFKGVLTEPWKQTLQLSARAKGDSVAAQDASAVVVWRDTGARAFAATVDGLGKLTQMLGVPATELWSKVPNASAEDVERWKATAKSGDALAMLDQMLERQGSAGAMPAAGAGPAGQPAGDQNPTPAEPWQTDVHRPLGV